VGLENCTSKWSKCAEVGNLKYISRDKKKDAWTGSAKSTEGVGPRKVSNGAVLRTTVRRQKGFLVCSEQNTGATRLFRKEWRPLRQYGPFQKMAGKMPELKSGTGCEFVYTAVPSCIRTKPGLL